MTQPEESPTIPPVVYPELAEKHPDLEHQDVPCLNCGYNLRGLQEDGRCPECGTQVERSLKGNLLIYSSLEHLANLHTGVFLILAGIILQMLNVVGSIIAKVVLGVLSSGAGISGNVEVASTIIKLGISCMLLCGWWLFSSPDPAILGTNTGSKARQAVRVTVAISAVLMAVNAILEYAVPALPSNVTILSVSSAGNLVAMMVKFFAAMVYLRWLAPRLLDERVFKRAKLLMWLVPVLVLTALCTVYIGLLVALVLYWNMLNWVRLDLKKIRKVRLREREEVPEVQ